MFCIHVPLHDVQSQSLLDLCGYSNPLCLGHTLVVVMEPQSYVLPVVGTGNLEFQGRDVCDFRLRMETRRRLDFVILIS